MKVTLIYLVSIFLSVSMPFFTFTSPSVAIYAFAFLLCITSVLLIQKLHFSQVITLNLAIIGLFFFSRQAIDFWWHYEITLPDGTAFSPMVIMKAKYLGMLIYGTGSITLVLLVNTIFKKVSEPAHLGALQKTTLIGSFILLLAFPATFYFSTVYDHAYALSSSMISLFILFCVSLLSFISSKQKRFQNNLGFLICSTMVIIFLITRFNQ